MGFLDFLFGAGLAMFMLDAQKPEPPRADDPDEDEALDEDGDVDYVGDGLDGTDDYVGDGLDGSYDDDPDDGYDDGE